MSDLSIDELLEPDMIALLPYHLFTHVGQLRQLADDPEVAAQFVAEFRRICDSLNRMEATGNLTTLEHGVLLELLRKVDRNIAPGSTMAKEVTKLANGNLAELETVKIYKLGERVGERRGEVRGEERGRRNTVLEFVRDDLISPAEGAAALHMSQEELAQAIAALPELNEPNQEVQSRQN